MASKLRVLADANVLVAGTLWPRFPFEVLRHAAYGDFALVLSDLVIQEARRGIAKINPAFTDRFERLLQEINYEQVETPSLQAVKNHANLMRDIKDIPIALSAIEAEVDFLITQDKDFTDRDETNEELHKLLNIILPGTFLREYMGWTSEALEEIRRRTWSDLKDG